MWEKKLGRVVLGKLSLALSDEDSDKDVLRFTKNINNKLSLQ